MRLPASGGTAGGAHPHPLETCLSGVDGSSSVFEDDEELTLLPAAGRSHGAHTHKRSFSFQVQNQMQTFQVALQFKPAADVAALAAGHAGSGGGRGSGRSSCSTQEDEPFLSLHDLQPSKRTSEWVSVGITLLPKISWGWLPFCFTFLGFSAALSLLLFITLFSVYSSAILYRLYLHSDARGTITLADIGEAAFGRRLGRRPVQLFVRTMDVALPAVLHVGGTRFLQVTLFFTTGVCLPWISLLFGGLVLVLAQVQRLGGHPALIKVVQPVLTGVAVATTLLKLELLRHAEQHYVMAIVQLISANYMGQHLFLQEMSGMSSPSAFQHSTALAQGITLLANLAVGVATLRVQSLPHVRGFISSAFGPDLLSRFLALTLWLLMTVKYVVVLHFSTKALLPRLPHLLVSWFDPDDVDSCPLHLHPRQLWAICSGVVVAFSFLVSCTFPHTFMYLSGLLTSVAYIPVAFTLPCLFSLKLLSGTQLTALEYTLSTWVIPVSVIMSLLGVWASLYHMVDKRASPEHGGSWGCNLIAH